MERWVDGQIDMIDTYIWMDGWRGGWIDAWIDRYYGWI